MLTSLRLFVLWGGILALGALPAEGGDGPFSVSVHDSNSASTAIPADPITPLVNADATPSPLTEETPTDLLDQPQSDPSEVLDFDIPVLRTATVDKHVHFFSSRIHDRFEIWLGRLERHRTMVEGILTEFNLPLDLAFLSLVESGFSTHATSRAQAVGPWQFIKGTAKAYGLRVDNWIDERRDPLKSTIAAASYLRDLYHLFGSWPLAMAAYNAGEGKVGRALARTQADNFWDLTDTKLLKRETKEYVPRFLAASLIARDPARFGLTVPSHEPVDYEEVIVTHPIHLKTAALAAETSYEKLKTLNPELKKDLTPPDPTYHLKVPTGRKDDFLNNLATYQTWKRVHAVRYQARRGDTLPRLASHHRVTMAALLEANAMTKSEKLKPGDWLLIPQTGTPTADATSVLLHQPHRQ